MTLAIAGATLAVWVYLVAARGGFWRASVVDDMSPSSEPPQVWPPVIAVVPARDEADVIALSVGSLLDLEYPGAFHIVLVDDQSRDTTAAVAQAAALGRRDPRLTVLSGRALPRGWTGKVWAMQQGVEHAESLAERPSYLLFSDADIVFAKDALRRLVARAEMEGLALTSLMAKLRCESPAERGLIPAFVFFFQMLYPFSWVNRPDRGTAAAAGGCMLAKLEALQQAGGLAAIRDRLIDDCALARKLKAIGPIWIGLTERAVSLRPYPHTSDVGRMISRSAYEQLDRSPLRLAGTVAGMALTYLAPPVLALAASGLAQAMGAAAWLGMAAAFQPMLRFYRMHPMWGFLLPAIASAYMVFTLHSAYQYARGRGGQWKGRAQANVSGNE
ncbi:MAG: glycosyltransferase [Pseudomonadota bacterium]|nr:glycosyltransferase [Pseudomonadota bacterium]